MSRSAPLIGFVGFGEAAFDICTGLRSEGLKGIVTFDKAWNQSPYSELIKTRASQANVKLLKSLTQLVDSCELVFSSVTANAAVKVAGAVAQHLNTGKLYIDINSASPMTKQRAAILVEATGAHFVDAAVMAAVPKHGHKVPMLVSGSGAQMFQNIMAEYGMVIEVLDGMAGRASAAKMCRSAFMKGYATLWLETLLAAKAYDCGQIVFNSISESISKTEDLQEYVLKLLLRTGIHAQRRAAEAEEVIDTLRAIGIRCEMSEGMASHLSWVSSLKLSEVFLDEPPQTIWALLSVIEDRSELAKSIPE